MIACCALCLNPALCVHFHLMCIKKSFAGAIMEIIVALQACLPFPSAYDETLVASISPLDGHVAMRIG